jgi:hypothetical protein
LIRDPLHLFVEGYDVAVTQGLACALRHAFAFERRERRLEPCALVFVGEALPFGVDPVAQRGDARLSFALLEASREIGAQLSRFFRQLFEPLSVTGGQRSRSFQRFDSL